MFEGAPISAPSSARIGGGSAMNVLGLPGIPMIEPGDDLAEVLIDAIDRQGLTVRDHDVFVLAQKIVSKAEGRYVDLATVTPGAEAQELAAKIKKDPRLVEVILSESDEVVRQAPGVVIVAHKLGYVMANAGIDASNLPAPGEGAEHVLLLPEDPDASCAALRARLQDHYGVTFGVIIADSFGRAWRNGTIGTALGVAGVPAVWDRNGESDLFGRELRATLIGFADQIAAAASLVIGEAAEGIPCAIVQGLDWTEVETDGTALLRPRNMDLFR